jgi:hypothetical protein
MKAVTAANVKACAKKLCWRYDAAIHSKRDSAFMRVVAAALGKLGILDAEAFMRDYATTVGHDIYLPFTVGSTASAAPSLVSQLMTVAHEVQHVILRDEMGVMAYDLGYLDSATRAIYEARCYLVNVEVYYLYIRALHGSGAVMGIDLGKVLAAYGCKAKDIRAAQVVLDHGARVVAKGGIGTAAAQAVGKWFGWM